MRRIREISIIQYVIGGIMAMIIAMTFIMLVFVNILAEGAVEEDLNLYLLNGIVNNIRNVSFKDGEIVNAQEFQTENEDVYYLLLKKEGEICVGSYPEGLEITQKIKPGTLVMITYNGNRYYVLDRNSKRLSREAGENIMVRAVVNAKEVRSEYQRIEHRSYLMAGVMLLLVFLVSFYIARKITRPMKTICTVAEEIGIDDDFSKRIDYDGRFKEIRILSQADNRMLERIERQFQIQRQFNSDVAHELRTPTAVILAQCEYVKGCSPSQEDYKESIEVIERQAKKTNEIIRQMLRLSRMEQGRITCEFEMVNLADIVRVVCEEQQLKADKNIKIILELQDVERNVDIHLITSLLENLLQNAIKYSDEDAEICVGCRQEGEKTYVWVRDYGCGIPKEEQKDIFQPFYRTEQSRNSQGIGLGLPLALRIAELHKGTIKVQSESGKGSIFTFIF